MIFADFIFYPLNPSDTAIILELKKDDTPEHAIEQIMERKYYTRFLACEDGKTVPKQNVLVVGMAYEKKSGLHRCLVKELDEVLEKV